MKGYSQGSSACGPDCGKWAFGLAVTGQLPYNAAT